MPVKAGREQEGVEAVLATADAHVEGAGNVPVGRVSEEMAEGAEVRTGLSSAAEHYRRGPGKTTKTEILLAHKMLPQTALLILTNCQGQRHAEGPSLVVSTRKASSVPWLDA